MRIYRVTRRDLRRQLKCGAYPRTWSCDHFRSGSDTEVGVPSPLRLLCSRNQMCP